MSKYKHKDKVEAWTKVLMGNAEHMKSRVKLSIQSGALMTIIIGFVLGLFIYASVAKPATTASNNNPAHQIFALVLLVIAFLGSIWWLVANIMQLVALNMIIKGYSAEEVRPIISKWIIIGLVRYPNRYLLESVDTEEELSILRDKIENNSTQDEAQITETNKDLVKSNNNNDDENDSFKFVNEENKE
ncbi:hypothetical protein KQ874_02060 [Mycoplasma sp. ES3157-GEN-MYC]|uniref:Uncharacterized protein n=1 Tax=Mycoplasma miroungigenitalium TaxID=754515 RepID=A0A6M4JC15_9MOLU|nr:hypothetical protein [Mycoplasma miroungigenitalium]MBU4690471.1 hypothetical protein [Mycoplasma miroungigenitalium]MBU4691738.1 hypothetical protein [Mycoplasma miroungigenitalium]QJR43566.1 hypothetical protein HLA87_02065 [Mycoplasma miroungigenitalium]